MEASAGAALVDRMQFIARTLGGLFLVGWLAWFWPFDDLLDRQGTPLGADFSMFYVAGQVAADGDFAKLYDQAEHQRRLHELFPGLDPHFCLPFRYPPAVAIVVSPLARLPYAAAWTVFLLASCTAFGLTLRLLNYATPGDSRVHWHRAAVWVAIGWPVALEVLIGGQASMFALLFVAAAIALIRNERWEWAGAVLALSAYKPNVLLFFALGIAIRYPRVLRGAVPVAVASLGLNLMAGLNPVREFIELSANLSTSGWNVETPFWKAHHLAPWLDWLVPGRGRVLSLALGGLVTVGIGVAWRRSRRGSEEDAAACAALLLTNSLLNPYTPIYDLVLLLPAAWLLGAAAIRGHGIQISELGGQIALAILFFGPHLSQSMARSIGIQLFPLALLGVGVVLAVRRGSFSAVGNWLLRMLARRREEAAKCQA